jgi:hypothetical protein
VSSGVVAEVEQEVEQLEAAGRIPDGLEAQLDSTFDAVAEAVLGGDHESVSPGAGALSVARKRSPRSLASALRRRVGPTARRLERRTTIAASSFAESSATRTHVMVDHAERLAAHSRVGSRALSIARPSIRLSVAGESPGPDLDGALLDWILDRLTERGVTGTVVHLECGDGRVVEELARRAIDARGADPRLGHRRADGTADLVAAGAFEYLGATPKGSLGGLLLSGVVDRLRPGAPRALVQLVATRLAPGASVVIVSARPEAATAVDPVASDLASGRPLHPVTWCHLLARYGLGELTIFEPDATEPDKFAVLARRSAGNPLDELAAGESDPPR